MTGSNFSSSGGSETVMVAHAAKRGRPRKVHGAESAQATGENLGLVVGQNMKRLRSRRNLSLEGLARLSGVSRAMLGQIELGRSVPTINVVWKIARAFDVPFSTMIATHDTGGIRLLRAAESKTLTSASGEFSSRALFPFDGE